MIVNAKVVNADNKIVSDDHTIMAIHFALYHRANVINMSFGGSGYSGALESAVDYAWVSGAVVVAAAGNKGTKLTKFYPAAYNSVIAVAATDRDDKRAQYDDPNTPDIFEQSNTGYWVDVAAPGKDIFSTGPHYAESYRTLSGTSMAAPHVSGLAGLILSKDGSLSPGQVRY